MSMLKKIRRGNRGLRYKLIIAFGVMSVVPLLACTYLISLQAFPDMKSVINTCVILVISIILAVLGFIFARKMINSVVNMAIEASMIASGEFDRRIDVDSDDEIGNLGQSINTMTHRIKTNLDELKSYSQRMRDINVDIHKKVLALSGLLQIGGIISERSLKLDSLLEMAVAKAAMVFDAGSGALYMPKGEGGDYTAKVVFNEGDEDLDGIVIKRSGRGVLERAMEEQAIVKLDKVARMTKDLEAFKAAYNLVNVLIIPVCSGRRNFGLLLVSNRLDNFEFKEDDIDIIKVFAKQITIAIESDILSKKTEELSVTDDLTGLYNKNFIMARLEEEIKRAIFYQRPCSLIVFNVDDFKAFVAKHGEIAGEEALKRMSKVIKDNMDPAGKAARTGPNEFAMLLPEKNKKEAAYIAEEVRNKIGATNLLREGKVNLTVSGGVSENPIDGSTADELFKKAVEAVKKAKQAGKNKVAT